MVFIIFVACEDMARVMAVDYGRKRTGLAVTDVSQLIAGGLTTVASGKAVDFIKDYALREPVECIVVGKSTQADGCDSENMRRVDAFVTKLKKVVPHIRIELFDERFTTVLAHRAMLQGGLKKKERRNKALADEISAVIILQDWLEARLLRK